VPTPWDWRRTAVKCVGAQGGSALLGHRSNAVASRWLIVRLPLVANPEPASILVPQIGIIRTKDNAKNLTRFSRVDDRTAESSRLWATSASRGTPFSASAVRAMGYREAAQPATWGPVPVCDDAVPDRFLQD
jgi:hypothetical protein